MPRASSTLSATSLRAACCIGPSRAGGIASHSALLELGAAAGACSAGRLRAAFDVPGTPPAVAVHTASVAAAGAAVAAKGGDASSSSSSSE
eukprot:3756106-Prymnesium_polylepis.1